MTLREEGLLGSGYRSVVVSLPTSSGKTFIAEFRILQALNQFDDQRGWIAYVAPTRALVNQLTARLRRDLSSVGAVVEKVSPALEVDGLEAGILTEAEVSRQFRVLVTTPEKLDLMLKDVEGEPLLEVRAPLYDRDSMPREQQAELKDELFKIVAAFLGRAFHIDGSDSLRQLFGEERGMDRALGFTGSFGAVTNTLGEKPKLSIAEWDDDTNTRYELRRSEVWDADQRRVDAQASSTRKRREEYPAHGDGPPPEDLLQMKGVKHSDFAFETVIRESLWNSARWRGVIWAVYEAAPPLMVLGFQNGMAAAEIITYLIRDIGKDDAENRLRISIIRGISKRKPFSYRVIIGSNWPMERQSKFGAVMFRIQTMEPPSNENLERFLEAYKREGSFRLGVTEVDPKAPVPSPPLRAGLILKRELQVREAWQIGRNDIDGSGVDPLDDVDIPAGREHDAPVIGLLEFKAERQAARPRRSSSDSEGKTSTSAPKKLLRKKNKVQRRARKANRGR